jgi:hypothetical protein
MDPLRDPEGVPVITYELLDTDAGTGIHCLVCGSISTHPQDVHNRYCGACHAFHNDRLAGCIHFFTQGVLRLRPDLSEPEREELLQKLLEMCSPKLTPHAAAPQWSKDGGIG